jgi:hypothetical protein
VECRFVFIEFSAATTFTLSAWRANYPWVESDSSFVSDNDVLNAVYELCRYTVYSASLDTYTDSNTRERTPYEADGIIAMSGRLLVQRDYVYARHSHAYVLQNPTWPVEWKQLDPFLGWQDYMATGQPDLALAFTDVMHERTQISFLNASNGVLNTDAMGSHIVDWQVRGRPAIFCCALRSQRPCEPHPPAVPRPRPAPVPAPARPFPTGCPTATRPTRRARGTSSRAATTRPSRTEWARAASTCSRRW